MADWAIAAVLVLPLTCLLAVIQISHLSDRPSVRGLFCASTVRYILIAFLGNLFTTSLAAATTAHQVPSIPPGWFWYAFLGVFGFEAILKHINLTFSGIGVLSISDWITKARDVATADVIEADVLLKEKDANALASRLQHLSDAELNAHVNHILGAGQVQVLDAQAGQCHADPKLVKALALAKGNYRAALAISPNSTDA